MQRDNNLVLIRYSVRDKQNRGAAFVESVVLLAAFTITMIGVLVLYSQSVKKMACLKIFDKEVDAVTGEKFNPYGTDVMWKNNGTKKGCVVLEENISMFF